jgi:hypothetical protein
MSNLRSTRTNKRTPKQNGQRNMMQWRRSMKENSKMFRTNMTTTSCKQRVPQQRPRINLRRLLKCLNRAKLLGLRRKLFSNKSSNLFSTSMKMKRRRVPSKNKHMSPWLRASNILIESLSSVEKKLRLRSTRWSRSSWMKEESKRSNTMSTERLSPTKLSNWRRKTTKSNLQRNLLRLIAKRSLHILRSNLKKHHPWKMSSRRNIRILRKMLVRQHQAPKNDTNKKRLNLKSSLKKRNKKSMSSFQATSKSHPSNSLK